MVRTCNNDFLYYAPQFAYLGVCSSTTVPMFKEQVQALSTNLNTNQDVLNAGFALQWIDNNNECSTCSRSQGECGYDGGLFKCFCKDGTNSCRDSGKSSSSKVAIGIGVAGGVAALVVGILGCLYFVRQRRKKIVEQSSGKDFFVPPVSGDAVTSTTVTSQSVSSYTSSKTGSVPPKSFYFGVQVFTYEELEEATKNFHPSNELGEGGFGTVYKGELQDGRVVAVKRHYESNFKRVEQFMNEVQILARLRHKNLVTLFGCTSRHSRELLLVYEFISNGTVADHLQGKRSQSNFVPWHVRLNIAVETAEALAYLHASDVIHRDVKSNNILLDDEFRVKVADFGLSRLFPNDVTHVSTAPQGTPGYVDPEYYQVYQLTDKSDVYSFGVVLVELISSLQPVDINRHRNDVNLANMAISKIQSQELHELVDPYLGFEKDYAIRRMTTGVAELAFRCLQQQREMRPSMDEVLEILRGIKSDELGAREAEVVDVRTDEVILLNKVPSPFSPDSVVDKWVSGSSATDSL
ncbi:LEAF RUST 10 DISEASE-RESISTANCE LOCUS RECEPTOR-LIKE PROTEIN KINASE-like 1.4 isoform X2 [Gastrolobium bilobum]|uniref:LEAF RUST 10 DISEASE-RESISTANCE LOCUS RECEPTOR-LIKE PROTEIN KINASE-like 1.4 isoform X2 n=1 Tax=Gastrolobium bilobum TaxID=150636 RepID=UPI002AB1E9E5|nr:LEAF RUST 10 DISEASE-RESISTANCE LOCUS RECEPTOR-LIKE PROTEIN KINASE-like 1.4 isoform X2 [Gastrolobium bilobum]